MKRLVFSLSFGLFFAFFLFTEVSAFQNTFWKPDGSSKAKPAPTRPPASYAASSRPPPKRPQGIPNQVPRRGINTAKTRKVPPRPTESLRSAPTRPRVVAETSRPTTQEHASSEIPVTTRPRFVSRPPVTAGATPVAPPVRPLMRSGREASYLERPFQKYVITKDYKQNLQGLVPETELPQILEILKSGWRLVVYQQNILLTAYDNCKKCTDSGKGITACSIPARGNRIIAVDPRYIPYGSIAYITGKHPNSPSSPRGWSFAADACGACRKDADKGKIHIDIHYDHPHSQNIRFGRQRQNTLVVLIPPDQQKPSEDSEFYKNMPIVVKTIAKTDNPKSLPSQLRQADAYEPISSKKAQQNPQTGR